MSPNIFNATQGLSTGTCTIPKIMHQTLESTEHFSHEKKMLYSRHQILYEMNECVVFIEFVVRGNNIWWLGLGT